MDSSRFGLFNRYLAYLTGISGLGSVFSRKSLLIPSPGRNYGNREVHWVGMNSGELYEIFNQKVVIPPHHITIVNPLSLVWRDIPGAPTLLSLTTNENFFISPGYLNENLGTERILIWVSRYGYFEYRYSSCMPNCPTIA